MKKSTRKHILIKFLINNNKNFKVTSMKDTYRETHTEKQRMQQTSHWKQCKQGVEQHL